MNDDILFPEAKRFDELMRQKADEQAVPLPTIPDNATIDEAAKIYEPLALESLASIAADIKQPASARVAASKEILDRSAGKATQKIQHEGGGDNIFIIVDKAREIRKRLYEPDVVDVECEAL